MKNNFLDVSGFYLALAILTYIAIGIIFIMQVFHYNLEDLFKRIYIKKIDYKKQKDVRVYEYKDINLSDLNIEINKIRKDNPYNEYLGTIRDIVRQDWKNDKPVNTIVNAIVVIKENDFKRI